MCLSRTVSEINGDFSRKWKFSPPRVFCAPHCRGSHWNWVSMQRVIKLEWWRYQKVKKSFKTGLSAYTQYRRVTDGQTDGHTPHNSTTQSVARVNKRATHVPPCVTDSEASQNGIAVSQRNRASQ